jgi:hypothetical protein
VAAKPAEPAAKAPANAEGQGGGYERSPERPSGDRPSQVFLETITPDAIPAATAASQTRIDAIRLRAPAIRSVYRKSIAFLATSTTLLAVAYWLAGPAPLVFSDRGVQFSERVPM